MLEKIQMIFMSLAFGLLGTSVYADSWTLNTELSKLSFGSIKKDVAGEVHSFERISGTVGATGAVSIDIDLASVQTNIDIRNERISELVFGNITTAQMTANVAMAEMQALSVGETTVTEIEGKLSFLGKSLDVEMEVFVARLSEIRVLVTTNDMLFITTEDAGIDAGISKLMALADLSSITRTFPVVLRLVFEADGQKAEVEAPAAPSEIAFSGDIASGKKVFKKCKACHSLKPNKNGVGPSLYGIIGKASATDSKFKYSKAMAGAGLTWDRKTLVDFLTKPKKYLPGTKMTFSGLKKEADIENLLTYMNDESAK